MAKVVIAVYAKRELGMPGPEERRCLCARRAVRPRKGPRDERIRQQLERTAHAVGMARFGKAEGGDLPVRRRVGAEGQQCRGIHPFFERV